MNIGEVQVHLVHRMIFGEGGQLFHPANYGAFGIRLKLILIPASDEAVR